MRQMVTQCIRNRLKFKWVLADSWFASSENMRFIHKKKKYFLVDVKSNRLAALSDKDRNVGRWTRLDELDIAIKTPVKVYLKRSGNSGSFLQTNLYKQR